MRIYKIALKEPNRPFGAQPQCRFLVLLLWALGERIREHHVDGVGFGISDTKAGCLNLILVGVNDPNSGGNRKGMVFEFTCGLYLLIWQEFRGR